MTDCKKQKQKKNKKLHKPVCRNSYTSHGEQFLQFTTTADDTQSRRRMKALMTQFTR